jgi:flagellar motor component MotA
MKTFLIIIACLILSLFLYVGSIYLGYLPIPKFVINNIEKSKNLSSNEIDDMYKISKIYQILKKSNSKELKELEKIVINGGTTDEILQFGINNYNKISDETFNNITLELDIDSTDSKLIKDVLSKPISTINESELDTLKILQNKYNLSDSLIIKLFSSY